MMQANYLTTGHKYKQDDFAACVQIPTFCHEFNVLVAKVLVYLILHISF